MCLDERGYPDPLPIKLAPEQQISNTLTQLDLALGVIAQLMIRLQLTTIVLDSFATEVGPRVTIAKSEHSYFVNLKTSQNGS